MALILLADDNPMILELLSDVLTARGHQVLTVEDGMQVSTKAQDFRPDLIVSDIQMPNVYGTTALGMLQENPVTKGTPVLFITGVPLENARKIVSESERVRLLGKPIDVKTFETVVAELLALPKNPPPTA